MALDTSSYLTHAKKIVSDVSSYLSQNFGTIKVMRHKKDDHFGIQEDLEANQMYEDFFRKTTPEVGLFTEEGEQNLNSEYIWLVDPIEGTSNYRVGIPFFATQVCLVHNGDPLLSVISAPILGHTFWATKGQGAFFNDIKIIPQSVTESKKALVSFVKGTEKVHSEWYAKTLTTILPQVRTIRSFGSCGLEMCYTAAGMIDVFISHGCKPYDYVPASLIMSEVGLKVTNLEGKPWNIDYDSILATNKQLYPQIFNILNG